MPLCSFAQPAVLSHHLASAQVGDLVARQAQLAQDFVAMLTQLRRAAAEFGWGRRVARGRAGLAKAAGDGVAAGWQPATTMATTAIAASERFI